MSFTPGTRLTARAQEDLIEIWRYISADDPASADKVIDEIENACLLIAGNPRIGPARDDIRPGFRYYIVREYLIFYRIRMQGVEVVRVLHGRRDLGGIL